MVTKTQALHCWGVVRRPCLGSGSLRSPFTWAESTGRSDTEATYRQCEASGIEREEDGALDAAQPFRGVAEHGRGDTEVRHGLAKTLAEELAAEREHAEPCEQEDEGAPARLDRLCRE